MINEKFEAQEYLDGKNISEISLYRTIYLLAKWYKMQGLDSVEIREAIFKWGKKYNVFITFSVNSIITKVLEKNDKENDWDVDVFISDEDVYEINRRFDKKNCKLMALGLLCYAKAFANKNKQFTVSLMSLATWLDITRQHLNTRYLKELIDFGYIEKVKPGKVYSWDGTVKSKSSTFKIKVPIENKGQYKLENNNIHQLYLELFEDKKY